MQVRVASARMTSRSLATCQAASTGIPWEGGEEAPCQFITGAKESFPPDVNPFPVQFLL